MAAACVLGGGPPGEAYTIARHHNNGGPRPLRPADHPQGLPGLTYKEWCQIAIGDKLLRFLSDSLVALAVTGYCGFIEHPQYPTWQLSPSSASIWCLDILRYLKNLQCTSVISFDQCIVGAQGRKQTTVLLIRLPQVRHALLMRGHAGRCHHAPGVQTALIGKQDNGSFQTSKAKIYHLRLNEMLGKATFQFAALFATCNAEERMPQEFDPYLEQQYMDHGTVQPDYHGIH